MSDDSDYTFENTDAGASEMYPAVANVVKKGGYIMIKGRPCKVLNVSTTADSTGTAMCSFTALDIFTNKKYEDTQAATGPVSVPFVSRAEYTLVDITDDGCVSLMSEDGEIRDDIKLPGFPEGFAQQLRDDFDAGKQLVVGVLKACGTEQIVSKKEDTASS